jgi:hypothetical protein
MDLNELFFFLVFLGWVRLIPLGTSATVGLLYQPRMIDDVDYEAVGGMRIGRGNRSTRRKPAPVPLCPPQIPHDVTWDRTRAAAVGSQRLTAWAMARPQWTLLVSFVIWQILIKLGSTVYCTQLVHSFCKLCLKIPCYFICVPLIISNRLWWNLMYWTS